MSAPHRVLFVEDYAPFKRSFSRFLSRGFGLDVTVAESGEEGIGQFGDMNPELVILDLGLPGVNGTETLQVIRALPGGESVPVIVLTGSNDPELRCAADQLDVEGYVLKENATGEFADVLLSIFPDLAVTVHEWFRSPPGSIVLDDTFCDRENNTRVVGHIPRSHRAIRILMPHSGEQRPHTARWARRFMRRARAVLPRVFG